MTFTTAIVLEAIASGHGYGFEIMDVTGLPSGTVYPALRRLERDGLLASRWERENVAEQELRPRRRYYRVSAAGERALAEARKRFHGLERVVGTAAETVER
jgi:DNA-binding PadR family transcriptional regulator